MEPTGVQRAITLVLVGLTTVGAASALANGDDSGFGDVRAMCLVQSPPSSPVESWPDPGFEPEPQRDFAFLDERIDVGSSMAVVDSATGAVVWTTVQGEHRAVSASALSDQLQLNLRIQGSQSDRPPTPPPMLCP